VGVTITVPAGQTPGDYWTYIRASSSNTGYDECLLNITVPLNNSWMRSPATFGTFLGQTNTQGSVGNITITNTGNIMLALRVYRTENGSDMILVSPDYLTVDKQVSRAVSVSYTVPSSKPQGLYYAKLLIRNDSAVPTEQVTDFWINVTDLPPNITNANVSPTTFELIYENVNNRQLQCQQRLDKSRAPRRHPLRERFKAYA
jgi:hypothetical protein